MGSSDAQIRIAHDSIRRNSMVQSIPMAGAIGMLRLIEYK